MIVELPASATGTVFFAIRSVNGAANRSAISNQAKVERKE
jgi:hypothetical protein